MVREDQPKQTQEDSKQAKPNENSQNLDNLFSPRFKAVAAMAGWDEESLIVASLIVEDTPDRQSKHNKRSASILKASPSTTSRRKRRAQRGSPVSTPIAPLNLEEEVSPKQESEKESMEQRIVVNEEKKTEANEQAPTVSCSTPVLHCMDKLREELSCAICLEICFEPSTTPCGHSFCKKCLRSAADKCGKRCPKCRQQISNGRSCTVNTVLWNTIQLLFPQEVEARKAVGALNSREVERQSPESGSHNTRRSRSIRPPIVSTRDAPVRRRRAMSQDEEDAALALRLQREDISELEILDGSRRRRRGGTPSQDEDAALALRLQREEFMESFRGTHQQSRTPLSLARENLRATASRAINIRMRGRPS